MEKEYILPERIKEIKINKETSNDINFEADNYIDVLKNEVEYFVLNADYLTKIKNHIDTSYSENCINPDLLFYGDIAYHNYDFLWDLQMVLNNYYDRNPDLDTKEVEKGIKYIIKKIKKLENVFNKYFKNPTFSIKTKTPEPKPLDLSDTSAVEKITFENKFDKVNEAKIFEYFKINLVEKKYLTEYELNKYLKQAFELRTPPKQKYSFKNIDSIENIVNVFYKYYKDVTTESTYGRQTEYFNLLKNYFTGFEKIHIKNFAKQYIFNT